MKIIKFSYKQFTVYLPEKIAKKFYLELKELFKEDDTTKTSI